MLKTAAVIGAPILTALAIAACGSGGSDTNASTTNEIATSNAGSGQATPPTADAARSAGVRFSQCMRSNGVRSFPDPGSGAAPGLQVPASEIAGRGQTMTVSGVSVSAPAFRAAVQKCKQDVPDGPRLSASQVAQTESNAISAAKCMRAHGVRNYPDPKIIPAPGGHGIDIRVGEGPNSGINWHSPLAQRALLECSGFLPG